MKFDPHIHSCYSGDSRSKIKDILKQSKKIGLDIIAISDHNTIKGSKKAIAESKNEDILVVPSIEISSNKGHILGLGVEEEIQKGLDPDITIEKIHDAGGIAIIPHPYSSYRNGLFNKVNPNDLDLKAIEVLNARYIIGYSNYKSKKLAIEKNLGKIGSSDSHFIESIGNCYTEINNISDDPSVDEILDAIKSKKTIAKGRKTPHYLIAKEVFNKKIRRIY